MKLLNRAYESKAELWSQLKSALIEMKEAQASSDHARIQEIQNKIDNLKHAIKGI